MLHISEDRASSRISLGAVIAGLGMRLRPILVASMAILVGGCSGCTRGPDLSKSKWVSVEVFYCIGDGKNGVVQGKKWATQDEKVLWCLRNAFHEKHRTDDMAPHLCLTNRVTITLENGQSWWLYWFKGPVAALHRVSDGYPAFALMIDPTFYDVLGKEIAQATGDVAHFLYDKEVKIEGQHQDLGK